MIPENQAGAERMAADIQAYWKAQGYQPPAVWLARMIRKKRGNEFDVWEIRSDLNEYGLPRKRIEK